MLMVNPDLEEVVPLEGDFAAVESYLVSVGKDLGLPFTFGQSPDGGHYGVAVSPEGTLVRLREAKDGFELRILADTTLANALWDLCAPALERVA